MNRHLYGRKTQIWFYFSKNQEQDTPLEKNTNINQKLLNISKHT